MNDSLSVVAEIASNSETFVPAMFKLASIVAMGLIGLAGIAYLTVAKKTTRRKGSGNLAADDAGSVIAVDFVLVAVPALLLMTLVIQMMWLMRETIVVHQAAFAVARAERAHRCPIYPHSLWTTYLALNGEICTFFNKEVIHQRTARYALIHAAPPWRVPCLSTCNVPLSVLSVIAEQSDIVEQKNALIRQAQYAFDPVNVELKVTIDKLAIFGQVISNSSVGPGLRAPVKVELKFRHYIVRWVGKMLGSKRSDGLYYRMTRAQVTLL